MPILTKDDILSRSDYDLETISMPEWGGDIKIRPMNGEERSRFEAAAFAMERGRPDAYGGAQKFIIARVIVDDEGNRVFTDKDASALFQKSAKAITRIWEKLTEISGIGEEAIEEAEGN